MASLEVMICTYGAAGICRVAEHSHPHVEAVRYLVGWQMPQGEEAPEVPPELMRDDFTITVMSLPACQRTAIIYFPGLRLQYCSLATMTSIIQPMVLRV